MLNEITHNFSSWRWGRLRSYFYDTKITRLQVFFDSFLNESRLVEELLAVYVKLKDCSAYETVLTQTQYEEGLLSFEEGRRKMPILAETLEKNDQGDYMVKDEDFTYDIAHCNAVLGFLMMFGGTVTYSYGERFRYTSNSIVFDTQMNDYLVIKKKVSALISMHDFPSITKIPTGRLMAFMEKHLAFLQHYEAGEILHIVPEIHDGEWFVVPKEFIKDEFWETPIGGKAASTLKK